MVLSKWGKYHCLLCMLYDSTTINSIGYYMLHSPSSKPSNGLCTSACLWHTSSLVSKHLSIGISWLGLDTISYSSTANKALNINDNDNHIQYDQTGKIR